MDRSHEGFPSLRSVLNEDAGDWPVPQPVSSRPWPCLVVTAHSRAFLDLQVARLVESGYRVVTATYGECGWLAVLRPPSAFKGAA